MLKYTDKPAFSRAVEQYAIEKSCSYIDAVLDVCEHENIDPEVGAKLLSQPIIEKLQQEAQESNMIPKGGRLPL